MYQKNMSNNFNIWEQEILPQFLKAAKKKKKSVHLPKNKMDWLSKNTTKKSQKKNDTLEKCLQHITKD